MKPVAPAGNYKQGSYESRNRMRVYAGGAVSRDRHNRYSGWLVAARGSSGSRGRATRHSA